MGAMQIGWIFFGWGVALAITSVFVAPWLQKRFGTVPVVVAVLLLFSADLVMMALLTNSKPALVVGVVVAGLFLGVNNTLVTETVMLAAPVERGVASAAYSFVRFGGGAVAPWLAGKLGEEVSPHLPFWVGATATAAAGFLLLAGRGALAHLKAPAHGTADEAAVMTAADA
jgi:MFS family permease